MRSLVSIVVSRRTVQSALRRIAAGVFVCALIAATPALASGVEFVDHKGVKIQVNGGLVTFFVSGIRNNANFTSGTLRLELWATSAPNVVSATQIGTVPKDFKLTQFTLGTLGAGGQFTNVSTPLLPLGTPPDGVWYYILFLTEFAGAATNDGFIVDDSVVELSSVTIGPQLPPPAPTLPAVEYYDADWGFYFVTAFPAEIDALDGGAFDGAWQRTGETFAVWPQPSLGTEPTCRFFSGGTFAPKSTHFYTPYGSECSLLKTTPAWSYEGIAFYVALPGASGACPPGTIPLYRAYNNGIGGAPNHRYTTSLATLQQMLDAGWTFEGNGITKTFACVPG